MVVCGLSIYFFFFFNDTATTEIYTLSLHDALPISIYNGIFKKPFYVEFHIINYTSKTHNLQGNCLYFVNSFFHLHLFYFIGRNFYN